MTIIEQLNGLQKDHKFILANLYMAQEGKDGVIKASEDYWRGALKAIERVMDMLGVEYEQYDPMHGM